MKVAIISVQGDVEEHVLITKRAMDNIGIDGEAIATISKEEIKKSDAIILPGGESTTISKLIHQRGIDKEIKEAAMKGKPIMGTCAGSILLAKHGNEQIKKTKTKLLGLMDIWVKRNAFGRQRESFQVKLDIKNIGYFNAVFIRAPAIVKTGSNVDILSEFEGYVVAARQKNLLALSFHPELADDTRIHEYFLRMAE